MHFLSPCVHAGFDEEVLCTDCMENCSSYSRDPDYLAHGFGPAGGMEYQQQCVTLPHSHHHLRDQLDAGSPPLCNGTPNGIRKDFEGSTHPKNHNTLQLNQHDRKGMVMPAAVAHKLTLK